MASRELKVTIRICKTFYSLQYIFQYIIIMSDAHWAHWWHNCRSSCPLHASGDQEGHNLPMVGELKEAGLDPHAKQHLIYLTLHKP